MDAPIERWQPPAVECLPASAPTPAPVDVTTTAQPLATVRTQAVRDPDEPVDPLFAEFRERHVTDTDVINVLLEARQSAHALGLSYREAITNVLHERRDYWKKFYERAASATRYVSDVAQETRSSALLLGVFFSLISLVLVERGSLIYQLVDIVVIDGLMVTFYFKAPEFVQLADRRWFSAVFCLVLVGIAHVAMMLTVTCLMAVVTGAPWELAVTMFKQLVSFGYSGPPHAG